MTTTKRVVPSKDSTFDIWVQQLVTTLKEKPSAYFVTESELATLESELAVWQTDFADVVDAKDKYRAAVAKKDDSRGTLEEQVRQTVRRIQADGRVTDAARSEAGLPVHKTRRTPVPVPKTVPFAQVINTDRLEHSLMFVDSATPTRRAKPNGVSGCEIHIAISPQVPTDPAAYKFFSLATRTPHVINFQADQGGDLAHYLLRWVNTKGEHGPWSQVVSATIPAI